MKILFLDCDGVLNDDETKDYIKTSDNKKYMAHGLMSYRGLDLFRIKYIRNIVKNTNCKIVISSSWRYDKIAKEYLIKRLGKGTAKCIIDSTPYLISSKRFTEIKTWLDNHKNIKSFVVLDDIDTHEGLENFGRNFICTTHLIDGVRKVGMTENDMNLAISILNENN